MISRLAVATIIATWVFWQIPVNATGEVRLPELFSVTPFEAEPNAAAVPARAFYRRTSPGQYKAYVLSESGEIARTMQLPGSTLTKADDTKISLEGKEGYITGAENGAFYIWYPQIGSQVYMFNERGTFLWEKDESHYLHVLPRGRFIMAAAGDHSRLTFMNPDFKIQADFQGVLFTRFALDDNPDLNAQACLGSLDGDTIVAHFDRRLYMRTNLGYALKSLTCDFNTGELAAIVERTVTINKQPAQQDFLLRARFDLKAPADAAQGDTMRRVETELKTVLAAELPVRTVTASALAITPQTICFVQTNAEGSLQLYVTRGAKAQPEARLLDIKETVQSNPELSPDVWKSATISLGNTSACLITHRTGHTIIADHRGILLHRRDLAVERVVKGNSGLFLQLPQGIALLK